MAGHLGALASKVDNKIRCLRDALAEYRNIRNVIDGVTQEKERLYQEKERFKQEEEMLKQEKERLQRDLLANREALEAMKEDLLASKNTMIAASDAITSQTEKIYHQDEELEVLRRKLQESEAKKNQADQQCGHATTPIQPRRVQTRSMDKRKRPSEGALDFGSKNKGALDIGAYDNEFIGQGEDQSLSHLVTENQNVQNRSVELSERNVGDELVNKQTSGILVSNNEELESVRNELIKGFLEIDTGGRKLGIREMGELDEKAFKAACLAKLPPEEVGTGYYQLYTSWQKQLSDLSWNPFKTVMIDGNCQEMVDVDDDKLQELKRAWGEGAHNAVIRALMEMQEYNRLSDRSIAYELWNYKEGRKATTREGMEYIFGQMKQLSATKRRKTRRTAGIA